jgi:hypothetical protein
MAPDGVELPLLVVNGQFPGPLIEANWVRIDPFQSWFSFMSNNIFRVTGSRSKLQTISMKVLPCIGTVSSRKALHGMMELLV